MAVRVGFVGTGGIAKFHFNNLAKVPDARIVALCDVVKEKVEAAAKPFGAIAYTCYKEMLDKEQLDALYVCVPPHGHVGQEELAVKKGIPIFVEKPIHLSLDKAKKIAAAIKKQGLVSGVGYQDRYQDIIDRLKDYLKERPVGLMMGYWMGGMPGVAWWRRKEQSGGQAVEQTTHIFDMARYLFGEVKTVYAIGRTGLMTHVENYNVEDASAVNLVFKNGVIGTIFSACFLSCGNRGGIDIFCKDSAIEYKERASIKIIEPKRAEEIKVGNDFGLLEDQTFIQAVKTKDGSKVRSTYEDSVKSLAVSLAANESMETGKPVAPGA